MSVIDKFLNSITMYRLVLYGLLAITLTAGVVSLWGGVAFNLWELASSAAVIGGVGYTANRLLAKWFGAAANVESGLITSIILFLILKPPTELLEYAVVTITAVLAMASKYLLAWRDRHIFNPAAIALVTIGLLGSTQAFWWVGSLWLLPVVTITGLLILRKQRRFHLFFAFLAGMLVSYTIFRGFDVTAWREVALSGPVMFFACIMLTEPATAPPTRDWRLFYGGVVGILFGLPYHWGMVYSSPELALVFGNLVAFAVSLRQRLRLQLVRRSELATGVYEFEFEPNRPLKFQAGQYMEWALEHAHPDSRGNRRYFTIASAPHEPNLRLGVRIDPQRASSFKRALFALEPGGVLWAGALAGDFTVEADETRPLVFIAGGIGVTPFRSIIADLVKAGGQRDITLLYCANRYDDFAYRPLLEQARTRGVKTRLIITGSEIPADWAGSIGALTEETLKQAVPSYEKALFYLSGPNAMVVSYRRLLLSLGVARGRIKADYFPGY